MGFLSKAFAKVAKGKLNEYSGNKDFLEAVCAASALVTAADGEIEDAEILAAVQAAKDNEGLSTAYKTSDIEECMDKMLKRAKTRSGQAALMRELDDVASKDRQIREDVFLAALDVSLSDGQIEPEEKKVLINIGSRLGVDAKALAGGDL